MKKFLLNILAILLILFIIDKLFYFFIFISPEKEVDHRLELILNGKMNKDVLIIGSSRGARNIIANQLEKEMGVSCFNLSYPGSDITFHEFLLKTILKYNTKPKLLILTLDDPEELIHSKSIGFRYDALYPLAKYDYINQEMINKGEKSSLSWLFFLSRMNISNLDLRKKKFNEMDTILKCGSMPISFQIRNVNFLRAKDTLIHYNLSKELKVNITSYLNFIELCENNGIKLVLCFCPNFRSPTKDFEERIHYLTNKNVNIFHYDTSNLIYKDSTYFKDINHLKINGARIFTHELSSYLNQNVKNSLLH